MAQLAFNYNFVVTIDNTKLGFMKVSGIGRSVEVFTYAEGGLNDFVHVFPDRVKNAGTLHLESGVVLEALSPFLHVGAGFTTMRIDVLNPSRESIHFFNFKNLVITKWELSELDAVQAGYLVDKFEVMYGEVHVDV